MTSKRDGFLSAVWLSCCIGLYTVSLISKVILHQARLVLRSVTIQRYITLIFKQATQTNSACCSFDKPIRQCLYGEADVLKKWEIPACRMLCRHGQLEEFTFHSRWTETSVEEVQSGERWCPTSCGSYYYYYYSDFGSGTLPISLLILFFLFLCLFLGQSSSTKPKPLLFQIRLGWNLAVLF